MSVTRIFAAATTGRGLLVGAFLVTAATVWSTPFAAASEATLRATYYITLAGFTIGRVDADGSFSDDGYTAAIDGATYGLGRIVSDSRATLTGSGRIHGQEVMPAAYTLATSEGGFATHVDMAMRGGAIVKLRAEPSLVNTPDRVPLTASHKRSVVDPVGAFVVALGHSADVDGGQACNRTVRVFDGWQRYDVTLYFKRIQTISGRDHSYSGDVFVCGARYVPVAGHRESRESVKYMADNKRLEVWLVPVENTDLMLPYRIVIGTQIGDLIIGARDFVVTDTERHASAE